MQRVSSICKQSVYKRHRVYSKINKCNAKRCMCCSNTTCFSTIKSVVNGRTLNVKLNSDVDWDTSNIIYVLRWNAQKCGIQFVGQTGQI